ncbi:hypothetical protein [Streptomyces sp. NBC_00035]|uniref:hypothetical protein n=1 Tax=Streptomyces sp. NBC_00035 TaxID=2903614 RepID=UPI0032549D03
MGTSRRTQAVAIVQRRVLALLPRATAEGTTVTVARHYTQLGKPASVSWTGDVAGFAQRIATALYPHGEQDETDDLNTELRDQLGDALIAAGAVPATMPVEILAQAGVLADAVLPVATRAAQAAATDAIQQAASLFEARHRALLDGDITTSAEAAQLLRRHAAGLTEETEEKDTPTGSQPAGTASTARAEILAVLLAAGYNEPAAREVLARADREPRDPDPDPDFRETLGGGHALVVEYGDCELHASCQCGRRFGTTTPDASLDTFVPGWERHTHGEVSG